MPNLLDVDVVVPTWNRSRLLRRTLDSLLRYTAPEGMRVKVLVVDNNSSDDTQEMLAGMARVFQGRLFCLKERRQGSSAARNAGIETATGDIVAFLDDDEEITATWYRALYESFQDPAVSYIGGPMLPNWEGRPPDWLPVWEYSGVLSISDVSPVAQDYGPEFPGMLISGNSAFRRGIFDEVGLYVEDLGRTTRGLGCGEDHELYIRLTKSGLRGRYVPEFAIYHAVPPERLSAAYYRRWVLGQAVSEARMGHREDVAYLFGAPRYFFGNVARQTLRVLGDAVTARLTRKQLFICELQWRKLAGFLYGTHFPAARKQPAK